MPAGARADARRTCRADVDRRRPGTSQYTTQRRETDTVRILSGVFEGRTTGTPIGLLVENEDQRSRDYEKIKDRFRPGHADYTYQQKYGFRDYRGGGRSSARETVMRVAAGAIARKYLRERLGVTHSRLSRADRASACSSRRIRRAPMRIRSSARIRPASRSSRTSSGACARRATPSARASRSSPGRAARARRAGVRATRRRSGGRHDGHQCGERGGDRRRVSRPWSSAAPSTATSSRRPGSRAIMRAACSAASPRDRTSS